MCEWRSGQCNQWYPSASLLALRPPRLAADLDNLQTGGLAGDRGAGETGWGLQLRLRPVESQGLIAYTPVRAGSQGRQPHL
jgi:hypothetical protein